MLTFIHVVVVAGVEANMAKANARAVGKGWAGGDEEAEATLS